MEEKESLMELGDHHSRWVSRWQHQPLDHSFSLPSCSVSSNIAQAFLLSVAEAYYHSEAQVRMAALQVVTLILRQGLVHPGQVSCA